MHPIGLLEAEDAGGILPGEARWIGSQSPSMLQRGTKATVSAICSTLLDYGLPDEVQYMDGADSAQCEGVTGEYEGRKVVIKRMFFEKSGRSQQCPRCKQGGNAAG